LSVSCPGSIQKGREMFYIMSEVRTQIDAAKDPKAATAKPIALSKR
jgi:hypothetical protein